MRIRSSSRRARNHRRQRAHLEGRRRLDAREIEINVRLDEIEEAHRYLPQWKQSARDFAWGADFGGSDETILTRHFDRPVIVHRYPAPVKAFYTKRDPEDEEAQLRKAELLVDIGVNVFLPASQVDIRRPADIGEYIGRAIQCKVLKIDEARRNIVVSRRSLIEKQREEDEQVGQRSAPGRTHAR